MAAVDVKLDALFDAAKTWHAQAPVLQAAEKAATGPQLTFTAIEMGIAAPFRGVYSSLAEDLGGLLKGASEATTVIAEALEKAATNYQQMVKAPVGKAAGLISDEHLYVDDYWQGSAATAYSKAVAAQVGAAKEFTSIVGDLQKHLGIFAAAGFAFYAAVVALFPFSAGWPRPVGSTIGPGGKDKWTKQK